MLDERLEEVEDEVGHPVAWLKGLLAGGWRQMRSVYYANSFSWRWLKSGALFFMGFFFWTSSNILLSFHPGWTWLYYPMAYGFLLIPYGPFTHLVMVPLTIRLRRQGHPFAKHLTKTNLGVFVALVLLLGTYPPGVMALEFGGGGDDVPDVDPDLICTAAETDAGDRAVHCHLSNSTGIDRIVVTSAGEELERDDDPPFAFTIPERAFNEVVGNKQFQVDLLTADGQLIRRYTRSVLSIGRG